MFASQAALLDVPGQDIDAAVAARMRRQQVLYSGKSIEILIAEGALLHSPMPAAVMAGQLHQLMAAIGLPKVRIGVLRAGRAGRTPVAAPAAARLLDLR